MDTKLKILIVTIFFLASYKVAYASITIRPALNLGLVGYWSMDEGSGTAVNDQSGYRNNSTAYSSTTPAASWVDGKLGKALDFDGMDDKVAIANNVNSYLNMTNGSISLWYKSGSGAASGDKLFDFESSGDYLIIGFSTVHSLSLVHRADFGTSMSIGLEIPDITTDAGWHHLVFTWDVNGGSETLTLTFDGVRYIDNDVIATPAAYSGTAYLANNSGSAYFDGIIDEVRIYNRSLSAAEVKRLYQITKPKVLAPNNTGLVGYWSFEEGMGTVAGDMSGNGNNGTVYAYAPSVVAADNFNRSDANPIGGSWTTVSSKNNLKIVSNQVEAAIAGAGAYWNANTFSANQYSRVKVADASSSDLAIYVRVKSGQDTSYFVSAVSGNVNFYKAVSGSYTNLKSSTAMSLSNNDILRLEATGINPTTLSFYQNGILRDSITDSTVELQSTGYPGIYIGSVLAKFDDWEGGNMLPSWIDGKRGKALDFDGTNDYVSLSGSLSLTDYTASLWFKPLSFGGVIISYSSNQENYIYSSDSTTIRVQPNLSGSAVNFTVPTMSTGTWYYLTVTRKNNITRVYLNSVESSTGGQSQAANMLINEFAKYGNGSSFWYKGLIDEVRIYNRALSATEVASLYQASGRKTTINTSQNTQMTTGLVGLWSFNGPDISGALALDRSGQGNNGTISGAAPAIGKVGQALEFDGTSGYVDLAHMIQLESGDMTFSVWAKPTSVSGSVWLVQQWDSSQGPAFFTEAGGVLTFEIGPYTNKLSTASGILLSGQWQHLVAVAQGTTLTIYVNGSQVAQGNKTRVENLSAGHFTIAGPTGDGGVNSFPGQLDEVRVYNRALSAEEIKRLYNMGK